MRISARGIRITGVQIALVFLLATARGTFAQTQPGASVLIGNPDYVALTQHERLQLYLKGLASPVAVLSSAASAGLGQWRDQPPEWGQGAQGYGLRFISSFGEHVVRDTLLFGTSSILHEDNRYIRSRDTGFARRLKYALESTVLARHDDGTRHISISKIGSFAGASAISRAWQPPSAASPTDAASNFGISIGISAGFNVVREFVPDLLHRK